MKRVLTYPLTTCGGKLGTIGTGNTLSVVRLLILSALRTYKTERIARNRYGISDRAFEPSGDVGTVLAEVNEAIRYALDPRYAAVQVSVSGTYTDEGLLWLQVGFRMSGIAGEDLAIALDTIEAPQT
jgi:hypothetical protein